MSILLAESYAAVCDLVTDVKVLSTEERNHVLWYACDGGDLSMAKSVIRAGCDVDHFHRGHTPLMMASIRGHDDVVKELILAGCKVDLQSSKCCIGWFRFVTKMVSVWATYVVWAVATLLMIVVPNTWVQMVCHWLAVLTIALHFLIEYPFKVSGVLRMKSKTKYMMLVGIVPAAVLVWTVVGTATKAQAVTGAELVAVKLTVTVTLLVTVIMAGTGFVTRIKEVAVPGEGTAEVVVALAMAELGLEIWVVVVAGTVVAVAALTGADTVEAVVAAAEMGIWTGVVTGAVVAVATLAVGDMKAEKNAKVLTTVTGTVAVVLVGTAIWAGKTLAITDASTGPKAVGKLVAVTGALAVALIMAMAGVGAVPFAVAVIVTMEVIMVGVGWMAGVAGLQSFAGPMTSVVLMIWMVTLMPAGVIRRMSTLSVTGMTALHYAAWYDHITCGTHLVEAGASVQVENKYFRTPLHVCSRRFRAAVKQAQSSPPKQVIAVIGNTEYGKSTLIAALKSESRTLFQSLVYIFAQVHNITQRTAGIETVPFSSAAYGEVLFYDFAGQSAYHGPHQPFLEAMLSNPDVSVIVLLLVKVTEERAFITRQLIRWLQPLALAFTPSTPHVIAVGSFLDQVKSKKEAHQKLQGCIDSVQKEYPSLKVQELFLLDCREPEDAGIKGLRSYLQRTHPIRTTSGALLYNIHWVMAQLQKTFLKQSLQLSTFKAWLRDNAQNLPTGLPPPEDLCKDLSAAGYILFLRNKQDLSQSWLVLDLQTILHNVYGTLFSPSLDVVNQFGLLHCSRLSELFSKLDSKMIQEVLITLEFCIKVDPLLLKEEMLSLTEQDEVEGWLYFPALVSAKADEVFTPDPQCPHWACWQLKTDDKHVVHPHLLQGIILGIAATHVFIEEELPRSVREHCCHVWMNGLAWGSTTGVDVALQISDSSTVQVIGRSKEGPGELYQYMSSVTQSIFKTIAKLSPALKATPYIIHPFTGMDESTSSPRTTRYPVASIIHSVKASQKYVHSLPISSGTGSLTVILQELFGGWSPSLTVVQCLKAVQADPRE